MAAFLRLSIRRFSMESKKYSMDLAGPRADAGIRQILRTGGWLRLGASGRYCRDGERDDGADPPSRRGLLPAGCGRGGKAVLRGQVPGGFIKREGRPTEKATLTCRLIDRPLRPLFNKGMRNDVQVVVTVLSVEQDVPPEIPAMIGSSIALAVSEFRGTPRTARCCRPAWTGSTSPSR